jgi:2-polyprenyl-6-methoxyphenol hydroxylase-like FAD-dependent oxidoreductase
MTAFDTDVLIVGAGPTGLTLACELARRGIAFRLIDAAPGPQPGSRGKGLQPRTLEIFDDLGLVDRVIANGRMAMPSRMVGPDGSETRGGGEMPSPRPDIPYPAGLITPEWRIEEALRARLAELGGAVAFDTALVDFAQTEDAVSATIRSGAAVQSVTARWLVGCDGGHSLVRKQAGIDFVGETLETLRMIVADVCAEGIDRDCWHQWRHAEGFVALCPLPSTDQYQYQASVAPGQDPDLGLANLQAILTRRIGREDIRLESIGWSSLWRANVRMVDRYRAGRILLAGDAAHIHSPAGGQGMNTGIQDAHNLGWKLAAVLRGAAPALIDTYEAERLPVAAGVLALSNELLAQAIAERGLAIRRDARTSQLGVGYRGSPLARDDRDAGAALRAGDRAPDATALTTTAGEIRLFDLLRGDHFTLLAFGPDAPTFPGAPWLDLQAFRIVATATGPNDLVDCAGHLAAAYLARPGTLVLIRPDGYVGLISDSGDAAAVADYLKAMGGVSA